jgi:hypothetical protein
MVRNLQAELQVSCSPESQRSVERSWSATTWIRLRDGLLGNWGGVFSVRPPRLCLPPAAFRVASLCLPPINPLGAGMALLHITACDFSLKVWRCGLWLWTATFYCSDDEFTVCGEPGMTHKTLPLSSILLQLEAYHVLHLRPLAPCHSRIYLFKRSM